MIMTLDVIVVKMVFIMIKNKKNVFNVKKIVKVVMLKNVILVFRISFIMNNKKNVKNVILNIV